MIDFLIKLLPLAAPAIRYADNKDRDYWNIPLFVYTTIILAIDIFLAHTFTVPQLGFPKKGEWTISAILRRLHPSLDPEIVRLTSIIELFAPGHITGEKT